ncbi:PREDICTED: ERO1-like protein beta [Amphimedon queenslandica]|uniref:Uncharacterized protein n=1 Tax=Amphimedon queenslandica TaxID=400682 RepID=A0A1X7VV88_AMPQE|nr:PREDICTED: ERO1-like protein beta [Amphimedon queenslandica]|eukprot:XP_019848899.1 PREDICTED: ERO1-like protein beta [Amphimedon queenslandica]
MMVYGVVQSLWMLSLLIGCSGYNPLTEAAEKHNSIKKLDECFCQLSGPVDVCCCDVETVDKLNTDKIYPLVSELIKQPYFKYFKINFKRKCPFWSDDGSCVLKNCHVEQCSEEDVPVFLKGEGPSDQVVCSLKSEEETKLSSIVGKFSSEQVQEFAEWAVHDDEQENFCLMEDDSSENASYVDLIINPERYTGYSGYSAHRIWSAIHNENCFRPKSSSRPGLPLAATLMQELCLEERAFFRLISGLHSSINIHVAAEYIQSGALTDAPRFGPNLNEFVRRFDSSNTNGQGPVWLKNIYFAYLVVLKAVTKAERVWSNYVFYTGNEKEEETINKTIQKLISSANGCGHSLFDEKQLFNKDTASELKEEFRAHFLNISRIMDCVGCSKCRLWGTLQVQGIGTALKILFSAKSHFHLKRQEIVALFNVLGRLSSSIKALQGFKSMQQVDRPDPPPPVSAPPNTHRTKKEL